MRTWIALRMAAGAILVGVLACAWQGPRVLFAAEPAPRRPNIVFFLADDLGYGDLACYGCTDTKTPVVDRLAEEGVRFTDFYANGPECTPTRTAFFTGRYQQRPGGLECAIGTGNVGRYDDAIRLAQRHDLGLPSSEPTVVRMVTQAGYTAAGFGKWHLGYEPKFGPLHHGFDHFFGSLGGGVDYYFHCEWDGAPMLYENEKPIRRQGYMTDLITEAAVEYVRHYDSSRPLFLYIPWTAPHTPIQGPGEHPHQPRTKANWNDGTRPTYAKMVERMDRGVGRILDALQARGLGENLVTLFASDNGGTKLARNAPFSGYKGQLYEGGIREPCIVRWPGVLPAGRVTHQTAMMMDLSVSIVRIAGGHWPSGRKLDGIDIIRRIEEHRPPQPRTLFWRHRRGPRTWRAVRHGDLKYLSLADGPKFEQHLFDLVADPGEKDDLANTRPEQMKKLKSLLTRWEEDVRPAR